ncbi:adiponectin receptor [Rhizoctonia solani AG-1 IB]|uniref:Adiponectin receptor n=1 Tax=Thanatephorus cucumeris (strain AG1-IB / isolate 7/3/14) TaxID=1108050 RepID=A0A0B7FA61_THACB|nr:adiponectin receptor [Rhizoctonia solani AG-1 IB]
MTKKSAARTTADPVVRMVDQAPLLTFDTLPAWLQDNAYILRGYRRPQDSWLGCARSVFGYLHNETVNIQTHLFGALGLLYLLLNAYETEAGYTTLTWQDRVVFRLALVAAIFCLVMSALFHTAVCHSPNVAKKCNALDYTGIIVVSVGTFYPTLHYGFFCDYYLKVTYIILITVGGSASAYVVLKPDYATPAYRWARALVFYALGVVALVPLVHAYFAYGLERIQNEMGFHWLLSCICFYVVGGMIYGCRIPERWMPGTFDYFGASHQILHVCVVLAMLSNYKAMLTGMEYWHKQRAGVCSA